MTTAAATTAAPAGQPFRLCVLDQAMLVQHSRLAQTMGGHFQQVRRQAQQKIEEDRRTLDADARALDSLRASVPPAVAKARDADIAKRRAELKERGEQTNRNLAALDEELTANVVKAAAPTARAVEAEQGCSMSIDRAALLNLRDASLDITAAVIDRMNAAPAPPPARTAAPDVQGR
ncbi:OmpH family outer membrane protein [Sphingopyxis fribergensis]